MPNRPLERVRGAGHAPGSVVATYRALRTALRQAGIPSPELDARLLVCDAARLSHEAFIAEPDRMLSGAIQARVAEHRARRLAREPVSRIVGVREFWGRDFGLSPATLDPRPDSETLIGAVLRRLAERRRVGRALSILDLGTGSGVLLLTLLAELKGTWGVGTDTSIEALRTARRNAACLGLGERARFVATSWHNGLAGAFDIIVANPPYVPSGEIAGLQPEVSRFDPRGALDGGADGLASYRKILFGLGPRLREDGLLALEVGRGQADMVVRLIAEAGLAGSAMEPEQELDLAGIPRCVIQCKGIAKRGWKVEAFGLGSV